MDSKRFFIEMKPNKRSMKNEFLVKYAEHLDCFISCSTNPKTALVFGWMDKSGLTVRV